MSFPANFSPQNACDQISETCGKSRLDQAGQTNKQGRCNGPRPWPPIRFHWCKTFLTFLEFVHSVITSLCLSVQKTFLSLTLKFHLVFSKSILHTIYHARRMRVNIKQSSCHILVPWLSEMQAVACCCHRGICRARLSSWCWNEALSPWNQRSFWIPG